MAYSLMDALQGSRYSTQEDPYAITGSAISQIAPSLMNPYGSTGANIGIGLGSALLTGLLSGIGQNRVTERNANLAKLALQIPGSTRDYRTSMLEQEPRLENALLSYGAFEADQDLANQQLQKRIELESNARMKEAVITEMAKNPRRASQLAQILDQNGLGTGVALPGVEGVSKVPIAPAPEGTQPIALPAEAGAPEANTYGFKPLMQRRIEMTNEYLDQGFDEGVAKEYVKQDLSAEVAADKAHYGKVEAARSRANALLNLANTADSILDRGLKTGTGAKVVQSGAEALSYFTGVGEDRANAGQEFESLQNELNNLKRVPGIGSQSDRELEQSLKGGLSLSKNVEANREITQRLREKAERDLQYSSFVDDIKLKGGTVADADRLWAKYEAANPLWVKEDGQYKRNEKVTDPPSFFEQKAGSSDSSLVKALGGESPTEPEAQIPTTAGPRQEVGILDRALSGAGELAAEYGQGLLDSPRAVVDMFRPSTYEGAFATPEQASRTVGTGAAMMAGGAAGAKIGAGIGLASPIPGGALLGGLLGTGIGAGAGYLGFNSAEEGASELAGVGTDKNVVPTFDDVKKAAGIAGGATGVSAIFKGVGAGTKAVGKATGVVSKAPEEASQAIKEKIVGVKSKDIEKAIADGKLKYIDDAGNEIPVSKASDYKTVVDKSMQVIQRDGFFDEASNSPKQTKLLFDQKSATAGQTVKDLHTFASDGIKNIYERLSPVQKKQFPITRDPKTGKGGFNPDFKPVFDKITELGKSDPQIVKALKNRAQAVIGKWDRTSRSYDSLQSYKKSFGKASTWKAPTTETANAWNTIKQEFYKTFGDTQAKAFDYVASKVDPAKVGALREASAKYSAYKNLEPMMARRASQGRFPGFGPLQTPAEIATKSFPSTSLSVTEGVEGLADVLGRGGRAMESAGGAISRSAPSVGGVAPLPREESQPVPRQSQVAPRAETKQNVAAMIQQLPPFYKAMVSAESNGNPNAVSNKGARGLMQIIPMNYKSLGITDPHDPEQSIKGGITMHQRLTKQFGDPYLALAAYNWGEGNLGNLITKMGTSDLNVLFPRLPKETRDYITRIVAKEKQYSVA